MDRFTFLKPESRLFDLSANLSTLLGAHGAYLLHEPRGAVEQRVLPEPLQLATGFVRFFC